MQLKQLGKTGLYVSELSLGTMTLGEADETSWLHGIGCSKDEAFKIIDCALAAGVNMVDTANVYGQAGMVEKLLGEYFCERKNRNDVVIATKFRFSMGDGPFDSGASRKHIMRAIEDSLKRLQTDYIDLYQVHMQDSRTPEEETLHALDSLIQQGKVRYIGASNYTAHRFLDAHYISKRQNLVRYCSLQMQYHLLCRDIEREHVPVCTEHKTGILVWSPLAGGLLSGKHDRSMREPGSRIAIRQDTWTRRFDTERSWSIIAVVKRVADAISASPSQVALAWLLKKPAVASVIVGSRKLAQIEDNLKAASLMLSAEHMQELDEVSMQPLGYPYDFINAKQK